MPQTTILSLFHFSWNRLQWRGNFVAVYFTTLPEISISLLSPLHFILFILPCQQQRIPLHIPGLIFDGTFHYEFEVSDVWSHQVNYQSLESWKENCQTWTISLLKRDDKTSKPHYIGTKFWECRACKHAHCACLR